MMSDVRSLTPEEVRHGLSELNAGSRDCWRVPEGKLHKTFSFRDFRTAMTFMQAVADIADEMDHHPEWCNVYSRVSIDLVTHSTGGISRLDFELARHIDKEYDRLQVHPDDTPTLS